MTTILLASALALANPQAVADSGREAQDSITAIANALRAQGGGLKFVDDVATAVQKYATKFAIPPALAVGVIGVENRELNPAARSSVGATGIMQVMPHWKADIRDCGQHLTDVDTNVCFGMRILRMNLDQAKSVRGALLRYNGCKRNIRQCGPIVNAVLTRVRAAEAVLAESLAMTRLTVADVTP